MSELEKLKGQKWLVAVSGGSDSMALLEMCRKAELKIFVAHVNYQKRESATRDMNGVAKYCKKYQIPCLIHQVEKYEEKGNFQAQARRIRYDFFNQCIRDNNLVGVLVAHHQDDVLETYLMQMKRKSIPTVYGIDKEVVIYGIKVKRALLSYSKEQLKEYCEKHGVKYYEDESNFEEHYIRNKIRHRIVNKMNEKEKREMIAKIEEENKQLKDMRKDMDAYVSKCGKQMLLSDLLAYPKDLQKCILRSFIVCHTKLNSVSERSIQTALSSLIHHKKENIKHNINKHYDLCLEYGKLFIVLHEEGNAYSYQFDMVEYIETPYFKICEKGERREGVTLSLEDFPITIRNARMEDKIKLRIGTKKVRRFFIDNKISHKERQMWPVVVNCKGNVIFVSEIGCDIEHFSNNSSMFVLKY